MKKATWTSAGADESFITQDLVEAAFKAGYPDIGRPSLAAQLGITQYKAAVLANYINRNGAPEIRETKKQYESDIQFLRKQNEQLLTEVSFGDKIREAFEASVHMLPKLDIHKAARKVDTTLDPEDIVLMISDTQIGQKVDKKDTGGMGQYDFQVFKRRMERYSSAVRKILKYTPNKIENCYVFLLGDLVEGSTIFRGQQRQLDLITVQQVTRAYEMFAVLLADLLQIFDKVKVVVIPGNHGRIGQKGENAPHDNLDWLIGYFLRERFNGSKRIEFHLPETWWSLVKVRNTTFLLSHGDQFKSWLGIPYYGAERFRSRVRETLKDVFTGSNDFDYLLCGHHHQAAVLPNIYLNGSWVGGSEYSLLGGSGTLPFQWILGVHDNMGISWDRKIILEDRRKLGKPDIFE